MGDVSRLDDRVRKLQAHFSQAATDIDSILISTRKVTSRGARIEALDFGEAPSVTSDDGSKETAELPFKSFSEV